jgi:hypothetical protein
MKDASESTGEEIRSPEPGWNPAIVWSGLGFIGWLAFELTAQPALVAVIVCSRFGWDDILTAFWLRRHDPHRGRGRTCFWFCLASAVLKMILTACAMAMLFAAVMDLLGGHKPQQNGNPQFPKAFFGPLYVMAAGIPLLGICAGIGCVSARWHRHPVWLSPSLHRARRDGCWPPDLTSDFAGSQQNAARPPWLAMVAILVTAVPFMAVPAFFFNLVLGALVLAGGLLAIPLIARRVTATHPRDCWGELDPRSSR